MGLVGVEGPPKKKLKQAQLNFGVTSEKTNNKRKLSDSSGGLAKKVFRKDAGTPKTHVFNKENVITSDTTKQKKVEPENDVIVVDDDSKGNDLPLCESKAISATKRETEKETVHNEATNEAWIKEDAVNIEGNDNCRGSANNGDAASETEIRPTLNTPVSENKTDDSLSVDRSVISVDDSGQIDACAEETAKCTDTKENNEVIIDESISNVQQKSCVRPTEEAETDEVHADAKDQAESNLDRSQDSDKGEVNSSITVSSEDEHVTNSPNRKTTPNRKLLVTPKSSSKKAERERQREEKLRLKKVKEEQRRKEKEEKEKKKQEELRLKEEEKKKKEEERKRREEAKEEERKRKEDERKRKEEAKEEERRKKEEEKKKKEEMKEEDRRKKEEARIAEEKKEKEKEERAKAAFTKFFITDKSKPSLTKKDETEALVEKTEKPKFMPFPLKSDMRLAVHVRHTLTEEEKDCLIQALGEGQFMGNTYLKELKGGRKPRSSPATWPLSDEQHDVIIVEFVDDDNAGADQELKSNAKSKGQKAKLLQFHENRRPPYWGTWRKPSKTVGPRRPFGQDKILDYEVDSDSEWEDEEEGEDIDKEDGDSDKEEADDENVGENGYVLDNTFVPHGYLSDEEAAEAEEDDSVEDQKLKLTVLKQEFDQELKSKTQRLQPKLLGCVYIPNKTLEVSKSLYVPLMKLRCKWDPNEDPIDVLSPPVIEFNPSPSVSSARFPSSMVEQLAKLIHGNRSSMKALISEFLNNCDKDTQLSAISKRAVFLKVKEIAVKTYSSGSGRLVWVVNPDLCAEFGLAPIVEPQKVVPVVAPVFESPKSKDSLLTNFLKKSTPQGPIKRISTTLVPKSGPSETPFLQGVRAVHIDTPRPKVTPEGSILGGHPEKPKRRVATTLLSSVAGVVTNKTFSVGEIDKPGRSVINTPKTTSVTATVVDLTDSNDGITPLSDEVNESVPSVSVASDLKNSLTPVAGDSTSAAFPAVSDSAGSTVPASSDPAYQPVPSAGDNGNPPPVEKVPVTGGSADPGANGQSKPVPMETEDSPEPISGAKLLADTTEAAKPPCTDEPTQSSAILIDDSLSPMETDIPSAAISCALPSTSDAKPLSDPNDSQPPSITKDIKPSAVPEEAKSVPPTPTPLRKRVPLITLSKTISKPKKSVKSPGQKVSIADLLTRKSAKKDTPSKTSSVEPTADVVDLCND